MNMSYGRVIHSLFNTSTPHTSSPNQQTQNKEKETLRVIHMTQSHKKHVSRSGNKKYIVTMDDSNRDDDKDSNMNVMNYRPEMWDYRQNWLRKFPNNSPRL